MRYTAVDTVNFPLYCSYIFAFWTPLHRLIDERNSILSQRRCKMPDRVGQQLGNYRLIRLLGQGGFADVYLAEHIHLDTQAAIKVLSIRLTSDNVEHFREEARTVARLVHPHIVRVLDFGVEGNTPYLAMDYAPNGTLRQRHPKGSHLLLATMVS